MWITGTGKPAAGRAPISRGPRLLAHKRVKDGYPSTASAPVNPPPRPTDTTCSSGRRRAGSSNKTLASESASLLMAWASLRRRRHRHHGNPPPGRRYGDTATGSNSRRCGAMMNIPEPAAMPTAAASQTLAAVVSPRTRSRLTKISPAPRKPIPETT